MKIRKKETSIGIVGKILNAFNSSKQDTYSCDYINKMQDNIQNDIQNSIKTKLLVITRDVKAENGEVSYTGVGFKPSKVSAVMSVDGTLYNSKGFCDMNLTNSCIYQSNANVYRNNSANLIVCSDFASWAQNGAISSFDDDGITINWSKVGSPTINGNMIAYVLCEK